MSTSIKRIMCAVVVFLFVLGLARAANFRFTEQERAFREECTKQLQKLGMTRNDAKAKYPTPEIGMVTSACLLPGATGEVVVRGKFTPGSKFVFQNDNIEVVKENLTPTEYRATVKAAAGIGPQNVPLLVMSAVTAISAQRENVVMVGGRYEWTMETANGWKVVARSRRTQACPLTSDSGDIYDVEFYRKGEAAPFEKRQGTLSFSLWEQTNYRFRIDTQDAPKGAQADYMQIMQQIADPKLTTAQRDQLMKKMEKVGEQMRSEMAKMGDVAYMKETVRLQEERKQQFGCEAIELKYPGGGNFTGQMRCSDKVGRQLNLTGTLAPLK